MENTFKKIAQSKQQVPEHAESLLTEETASSNFQLFLQNLSSSVWFWFCLFLRVFLIGWVIKVGTVIYLYVHMQQKIQVQS